jgi:hypothetical protein
MQTGAGDVGHGPALGWISRREAPPEVCDGASHGVRPLNHSGGLGNKKAPACAAPGLGSSLRVNDFGEPFDQ